ncbi:MAG TPA: FtsX-like permease family protein [Rhodanobacter sp.]|nr:FtsX-like permease family protein [Rhodanobacter sp.]
MLGYYLDMALRSCRRSKALTALVVLLMGVGVATCMVSYAVFRAASADPIPWKSGQLFVPQIDNVGPVHDDHGEPLDLLSYTDAIVLLRAYQARRQTVLYAVKLAVVPDTSRMQPFSLPGDAVSNDFFAMFDVPFRYGGGWTASDDEHRAALAVISSALNRKLFGGADSVGREIHLDTRAYRIVGVMRDWNPRPRIFDHASAWNAFGNPVQVFIPFSRAIDLQKSTSGTFYCSTDTANPDLPNWESILRSECVWIAAWVELPTRADVKRYRDYLHNYAAEQQRTGRFDWPPNVRLRNLMQWMDVEHVVPKTSALSMIVSISFLLICLINVVGLMLARFMRRAPEIGVRRALGASRGAIHRQFLVEAAAIGLAGGVLGLLLTALGMAGIGHIFEPEIARLATLDAPLLLLTMLVAVAATLIAALYPTWRAAQVQPAWQLKSN